MGLVRLHSLLWYTIMPYQEKEEFFHFMYLEEAAFYILTYEIMKG